MTATTNNSNDRTNKTLNKLTNIIGILVILAASLSVFLVEKVNWMDASFGIAAGAGLIYVKNNTLVDKITRK